MARKKTKHHRSKSRRRRRSSTPKVNLSSDSTATTTTTTTTAPAATTDQTAGTTPPATPDPNKPTDDKDKKPGDDKDKKPDDKPKSKHHYKTIIFFLVVMMGFMVYIFVSSTNAVPKVDDPDYQNPGDPDRVRSRTPLEPASTATKGVAGGVFALCTVIVIWRIWFKAYGSKHTLKEIKEHYESTASDIINHDDFKDKLAHVPGIGDAMGVGDGGGLE